MFTHLHVHTEYSLLDGISRITDLMEAAESHNMSSLAITDHGVLYGAIDFYSAAKSRGINPIIGCEMYEARNSRLVKDSSEKRPFHLTVLAHNNTGYKNLLKLVSIAHMEDFYYRPRIDDALLEKYNEGLIILSGCPNSKISRDITDGNLLKAKQRAGWLKEVFGDRFFMEIQQHDQIPDLPTINTNTIEISKSLDIPLVATNDSHYTAREHAHLQDIRMCISTNSTILDSKRLKMEGDSFYLKSSEEMMELFKELPDAITNTQRIAERCEIVLPFGEIHLPRYPVPDGIDVDEYLSKLCWEGLTRIYGAPPDQHKQRLKYELEVIKQTRFAHYFLVVWQIVSYTREKQILFGVRGSAAASLALYCLGVTDVDPMEHRLVFERFLNLERKEMPDIDMDFQDDRRDEVLQHVTQQYGKDKVAQIITFGTLGPKAALRDVGRARNVNYGDVDRLARLIPFRAKSIQDAIDTVPEIQHLEQSRDDIRELLRDAQGLEGIAHHVSTHAAGVVISEDPLTEYVPLQRPTRAEEDSQVAMTQFAMDPIAKLGLLKMDFLGLTNLTILDKTLKVIEKTRGLKLSLKEISTTDDKTFDLLSSGNTTEVFQLESTGMQKHIKALRPSSVSDVAAMIALYRPGPMEQIPNFIAAKHGEIPVISPHSSLDDILNDSYGIIVFQDQVLLILQTFAGYSLGEADIVRKAMGKKIPSLMAKERDKFIAGATNKGFDSNLAEEIFNLIEPFAGYAFNKAHSVSYAQISYWTAYFKANYPLEYMASVLNSRSGHPDKISNAINECLRMEIKVLPPNINYSQIEFTIETTGNGIQNIRFGLSAIKNLGATALTPIIQAREKTGGFASLEEFARNSNCHGLNRRGLESLIKAGAFDTFGPRKALLDISEQLVNISQQESNMRSTGQTSLFGDISTPVASTLQINVGEGEVSLNEIIGWERELLGVTISSTPLSLIPKHLIPDQAITSRSQISSDLEGKQITVLGQVTTLSERMTRDNRQFLSASIDLLGGYIEVVAWPHVFDQTRASWGEGKLLLVTGKVKSRGPGFSIYCDTVSELEGSANSASDQNGRPKYTFSTSGTKPSTLQPTNGGREKYKPNVAVKIVELTITNSDAVGSEVDFLENLIRSILEFNGDDRVQLRINTVENPVLMEMPFTVKISPELESKITEILGPDRMRVKTAQEKISTINVDLAD